jgi:hypothetical protein
MTLVLDATPSGTSSNAYTDAATAQAIIDATPNACAWTDVGSDLQERALVYATSMLDALPYQGIKVSFSQALQWPRGSVIDPDYGTDAAYPGYMVNGQWGAYLDYRTIPKRMVRACTMLALEILRAGKSDVWGVDETANWGSKQIDTLITQFVPVSQRRFGLRIYPSVWREVYPLTLISQQLSVERA